jgi:hypothetical protein
VEILFFYCALAYHAFLTKVGAAFFLYNTLLYFNVSSSSFNFFVHNFEKGEKEGS